MDQPKFLHDNGYRPPRDSVVSRSGVPLDEVRQAAEWVALTIASGVLGNATYDAFKAGVQRLRHRGRTRAAAAASAGPASATAGPASATAGPASATAGPASAAVPLTAEQALLLAHTAVLRRCEAIDIERPDLDRLRSTAYQDGTGRWVFAFRDPANRRFHVRVPPDRPAEGDVTVEVYLPPSRP